MTRPMRLLLLADPLGEGWTSMDLVADMLSVHLSNFSRTQIEVSVMRPQMSRMFRRVLGDSRLGFSLDRFLTRYVSYPRLVARSRVTDPMDVYHVIDHTYAHLATHLPGKKTLVTCHDVDAFRVLFDKRDMRRNPVFRWMARRQLLGLRSAAIVSCDSAATRAELIAHGLVRTPEILPIVPLGVDAAFSPAPNPRSDADLANLLPIDVTVGPILVHVGSTIPRKRIDTVIRLLHRLRQSDTAVHLVRAGGPLRPEQRALAAELGVVNAIHELPFVDRNVLAALYRLAAVVVQPSSAEGFGLPVAEALSCGAVVIASDIPVLRETGGAAALYCPVDDVDAWTTEVASAIATWRDRPDDYEARRFRATQEASRFSWSATAQQFVSIYTHLPAFGDDDAAAAPGPVMTA